MIDIEKMVKEFAETYGFLQDFEIDMVETSVFQRENYLKIDNKKFISIQKYTDKVEIAIGKIIIEIDSYDENEWYSIDKNTYIRINIDDFPNEDSLIKECKKYDLI
jgi:hypothetical protein